MWMRAEYAVLLLVVFSNWQWVSSTDDHDTGERNEHARLLDSLLLTLQQLAKFYNREYQNVNLDSIYGVRVAEGALKSTLEDINSGASHQPTPKVLFTINNLYSQFSGIARKSLQYLQSSSPDYYTRFSKVVAEPWNYFKSYKRLDHTIAVPLGEKKEIHFAEEMSDRCMVGLMGSENKTSQPCQISEECWNLMSKRGYKEYVTTHQALFFILGDIQGCRKQLETNLKKSGTDRTIEDKLGKFCSDIYPEMVHIEEGGYSVHEQDLFMEQGIVCGMLGYYEFLDEERLLKILSWKTPYGCYGFRTKREAEQMLDSLEDEDEATRKRSADQVSWNQDQSHTQRKLMSMDTRRKLLVETALAGGCMAHMTGVAVGLLGVYVKWMIATVDADDDSVPGTHVISARSIYSHGSLFDNTLASLWMPLGLMLTLAAVLFILFKNRTLRLIKRLLNITTRMTIQKDMKYIY